MTVAVNFKATVATRTALAGEEKNTRGSRLGNFRHAIGSTEWLTDHKKHQPTDHFTRAFACGYHQDYLPQLRDSEKTTSTTTSCLVKATRDTTDHY